MEEHDEEEYQQPDHNLEFLLDARAAIDAAIDAMHERDQLKKEELYWRTQYQELLSRTIKQSDAMAANILMLALTKGDK